MIASYYPDWLGWSEYEVAYQVWARIISEKYKVWGIEIWNKWCKIVCSELENRTKKKEDTFKIKGPKSIFFAGLADE